MCGIVGYIGFAGAHRHINVNLEAAQKAIKHRGPDEQNITVGPNYRVAFNRLSINDLSHRGMQPFSYDDVYVFINGEIYNYVELRRRYQSDFIPRSQSDVEIVPFLYAKQGLNFLNEVNGMFSMVIIDNKRGCSFLIVDRFGVRPMYYTHQKNVLYFSSELKGLAEMIHLEPDPLSIRIAANITSYPYPLTPFREIKRLGAGRLVVFRNGKLESRRWYFPNITGIVTSEDEVRKNFFRLFDRSVSLRLRADVPIGGYISGGLDSSLIVSTACKKYGRPFHLYTAVFRGKEILQPADVDNRNSSQLAKELPFARHHRVEIDFDVYQKNIVRIAALHDEILFNNGSFMFYLLAREARKDVKVLLDGVGGDEIFGGYLVQKPRLMRQIASIFVKIGSLRFLYSPFAFRQIARLHPQLATSYKSFTNFPLWFAERFTVIPAYLMGADYDEPGEILTELSRKSIQVASSLVQSDYWNAMQFYGYDFVVNFQNVQSDRGAMAYSIEGRNPFLDFELVEYMMKVDSTMKLRGGQKGLMRRLIRDRVPNYIVEAPKSGPAMPINIWLRNHPSTAKRIFSYIRSKKETIEYLLGEHVAAEATKKPEESKILRHGVRLHALLALLIWSRKYLEKKCVDLDEPLLDFMMH
ncbi:MAG: asparagine synthase (glutamine-hydrolyzing) [Candidatus Hydrogenedentota bacterium]|nr:MAG: asparagine synthase (glutamine-hydrolyzing) [Candidatus Hydrogenedentota bacterium]